MTNDHYARRSLAGCFIGDLIDLFAEDLEVQSRLKVSGTDSVVFPYFHDALCCVVVSFFFSPLRVAPNNVRLFDALIEVSFQNAYFSGEPLLSLTKITDLLFKLPVWHDGCTDRKNWHLLHHIFSHYQ